MFYVLLGRRVFHEGPSTSTKTDDCKFAFIIIHDQDTSIEDPNKVKSQCSLVEYWELLKTERHSPIMNGYNDMRNPFWAKPFVARKNVQAYNFRLLESSTVPHNSARRNSATMSYR